MNEYRRMRCTQVFFLKHMLLSCNSKALSGWDVHPAAASPCGRVCTRLKRGASYSGNRRRRVRRYQRLGQRPAAPVLLILALVFALSFSAAAICPRTRAFRTGATRVVCLDSISVGRLRRSRYRTCPLR